MQPGTFTVAVNGDFVGMGRTSRLLQKIDTWRRDCIYRMEVGQQPPHQPASYALLGHLLLGHQGR